MLAGILTHLSLFLHINGDKTMAITHNTSLRNNVRTRIISELGSGTAKLLIQTSASATLATISTLNVTATGTAGEMELADTGGGNMEDTNVSAGTAAKFVLQDTTGTDQILGTVTATGGGGDIELSSTAFSAGDAVRINSFSYTVMV